MRLEKIRNDKSVELRTGERILKLQEDRILGTMEILCHSWSFMMRRQGG